MATKALLLGYPQGALYICVALHDIVYYPLIVLGLIRRYVIGQAIVAGLIYSMRASSADYG